MNTSNKDILPDLQCHTMQLSAVSFVIAYSRKHRSSVQSTQIKRLCFPRPIAQYHDPYAVFGSSLIGAQHRRNSTASFAILACLGSALNTLPPEPSHTQTTCSKEGVGLDQADMDAAMMRPLKQKPGKASIVILISQWSEHLKIRLVVH